MVDQRVDQRAGPVAGAGMDDQPGRLVDDDQLGVLMKNVERDRLALRLGGLAAPACRRRRGRRRPSCGSVSTTGLPPILHRALLDQRLHAAARKVRAERGGQPLVEALAGRFGGSRQHYQSAASSLRYQGRSFAMSAHRNPFGISQPWRDRPRRRNRGKAARPGRRARAQEAGPLRRDQSRPAVPALMAVVAALVYKSGKRPSRPVRRRRRQAPAGEPLSGDIVLPAGAKVVGQALRQPASRSTPNSPTAAASSSSTTSPSADRSSVRYTVTGANERLCRKPPHRDGGGGRRRL